MKETEDLLVDKLLLPPQPLLSLTELHISLIKSMARLAVTYFDISYSGDPSSITFF